jgi:hypothetical protein
MTSQTRWTRRRVLGASAASAAAIALNGGRLQDAIASRKAPAFLQASGKIT